MKNVKVLSFDLDGTLLRSDKTIDEDTIKWLEQYTQAGNYVFLASGRKINQIAPYIRKFSKAETRHMFIISSGGQYIYNFNNQKIWTADKFDCTNVHRICSLLCKEFPSSELTVVTEKRDYVIHSHNTIFMKLMNIYYFVRRIKEIKRIRLEEIEEIDGEIEKIILHTIDIEKVISSLKNQDGLKVLLIEKKQVDVRNKNVNKSNAILYLLNELKISEDDIMVFGDDENDEDVFERFPFSIAMLNATNSIKTKAWYITESNDNKGILKFLSNSVEGK